MEMGVAATADAAALDVLFLPFPAAGHSIPMLDVASIFASCGATCTVVLLSNNSDSDSATNSNRCCDRSVRIRFLHLPFSYTAVDAEAKLLPSAYATPEFETALDAAAEPFFDLLKARRPDCVVADLLIPFAAEHAAALAIPHLTLQVTCAFSLIVMGIINHAQPHLRVSSPSEPFLVPGLPHRIELTPAQLPAHLTGPAAADRNRRILTAQRSGGGGGGGSSSSLGMILNTFHALEPAYVDMLRRAGKFSVWCLGPIFRAAAATDNNSSSAAARRNRQQNCPTAAAECLKWLDRFEGPRGSVLFLCFGSQGRFTRAQLGEIARGLEMADAAFVWVVNGEEEETLPKGFEERIRISGKGLVVRGWAPQVEVLGHTAVGGFATHCGWNSCMEGIAAGVAMVTWPLYAEQFVNERLVVDVLDVGAPVGAKVWSDRAEERGVVTAEAVAAAVAGVMGEGTEAEGRRRRARDIGEAARRAVEERGTTHEDMSRLVAELLHPFLRDFIYYESTSSGRKKADVVHTASPLTAVLQTPDRRAVFSNYCTNLRLISLDYLFVADTTIFFVPSTDDSEEETRQKSFGWVCSIVSWKERSVVATFFLPVITKHPNLETSDTIGPYPLRSV